MKKILVIGSLNMDLVTQVKDIPKEGETVLGSDIELSPGGKGANQAVSIGKLGGDVTMLGVVGKDKYGSMLIESLSSNNVDCSYIKKMDNSLTGVAYIMVNQFGNNSIVVNSGANMLLNEEIIDQIDLSVFDIIIAQMEIPINSIIYAFSRFKALGGYTILNPAPAKKLPKELLENVDLLIPNETEFEIITGSKDIKEGVMKLMDFGISEVIVTLGENGSAYYNKDGRVLKMKSYDVKAIDTTSAGDSFIGACGLYLSLDKTIDEVIEFATKVSALTVCKKGAQISLPNLDDVRSFKYIKRKD